MRIGRCGDCFPYTTLFKRIDRQGLLCVAFAGQQARSIFIEKSGQLISSAVEMVGEQITNHVTDAGVGSPAIGHRPLVWLNLVCLDAPLVAITWQYFFAQSLGVSLPTGSQPVLLLTAWLIYLADRLADSISVSSRSVKTLRQEFCLHYRNYWFAIIAVVAITDAGLVFLTLDNNVFVFGIPVAVTAVLYLGVNFEFSRIWTIVPIKEIAVGMLFAAGTYIAVAPVLSAGRSTAALVALGFGGVCSLNCVSIAVWERDVDRAQGKHSIATSFAPGVFVCFFAVASIVLAFAIGILLPHLWLVAGCYTFSVGLLLALYVAPVERDERTALADLVLLTPLFFLLIERIS